jgi:hypothetical protein
MGTTHKSVGSSSNGEEKMGTEVKSVEGSIDEGFDFGAVASGLSLKDVDLSVLDAPDMDEFLKQPLHADKSQKVNEVSVRKTRKATRTLPEPTGELRNLYVIPSLRYGLVCLKVPADAHVTKEGAITIKKGTYVPAGRWSWDMEEAKSLLSKKINETINGYQEVINQYAALNNPPVREDGIDTYLRLCGRGKASIEKYVLGVNVLPDPKEEKVKEDTTPVSAVSE